MDISRITQEISSILYADKMMLNYLNIKSSPNTVNLHYYIPVEDMTKNNLGDYLSKVVVEYMLKREGLQIDSSTESVKHLYGIGSILQFGYQNATVWGSAFAYDPSNVRSIFHRSLFRKLDIRAVRGPMTRNVLMRLGHNCPECYGDPAVLMPLIYQPNVKEKKDYVIVPHFSQLETLKNSELKNNIVSMYTSDYESVIDSIANSKFVVSSSLHGLILAEAYGVPAIFYQDRPERFNFKYEDWYSSTKRKIIVRDNIKTALNTEPLEIPDLKTMQDNLLETFPYDLWK